MHATYSLSVEDFTSLQRAVARRFERKHGRLNVPFFLNVFAWMCVTLGAFSLARVWQQDPEATRPYMVLATLFLVGFISAVVTPWAAQRTLRKYVVLPGGAFLAPQTIEPTGTGFVVASAVARSDVAWSAILDRVEDDRNYYLFIDTTQALLVPKTVASRLGGAFQESLLRVRSEA